MLTAPELDSKVFDDYGFEGQLSLGEDEFYQKYEEDIKSLTEKFMPPKEEDARSLSQYRQQMEQYVDYRNYLTFSMYEKVEDENGNETSLRHDDGLLYERDINEGALVTLDGQHQLWKL